MPPTNDEADGAEPTAPHSGPDVARRDPARWSQIAERGSLWGMRFVAWSYRTFGRRIAEALIHVIVAYFFATDPKGRRASLAYLRRVYRSEEGRSRIGREPGWWQSFLPARNGCCFRPASGF